MTDFRQESGVGKNLEIQHNFSDTGETYVSSDCARRQILFANMLT